MCVCDVCVNYEPMKETSKCVQNDTWTAPLDRSVSSCVCRSLRSLFCRVRASLASIASLSCACVTRFARSFSRARVSLSSLSCGLSEVCPVCGGPAIAGSEPSDDVARQATFVCAREMRQA